MRRIIQFVGIAVALCQLTASGQEKSKFSGTWIMDMTRSDSARVNEPPIEVPVTLVVTQRGDDLQIETVWSDQRQVARYSSDNSATPRSVGTSGGDVGRIVKWDESSITTQTLHVINDMAVTTVERRSLSPDGREMIVQTTLTVQHGYQAGSNYSTPVTDVFVKKAN